MHREFVKESNRAFDKTEGRPEPNSLSY